MATRAQPNAFVSDADADADAGAGPGGRSHAAAELPRAGAIVSVAPDGGGRSMRHTFGPFTLDEEARELSLRGAPVPLQPRVFDLLVHLVRNAGRVVPKDELMETLWPDVIVTEASLQRLVSLARRALQAGGLGNAIRSFVRHGYRFAIEDAGIGVAIPAPADAALSDALRLVEQRAWGAAADAFERLDADGRLRGEDIDVWALAVECRGRPADAIPVLIRSVTTHEREGRRHLAARGAVTIAKIEAGRGAMAAATGWMDRAEALKAGIDDARTDAYFLWMKARLASFAGRPDAALALADASHRAATACNDPGLTALALTFRGFYKIALGRVEEGVGEQNHAAALALSSGVDPIIGATVYCNILWSCRTFADFARARQWSLGFESWCRASFAEVPGACGLHRAEVVGSQDDLAAALAAIEEVLPKLTEDGSWSIGDGYRVRGDIRAMLGDLDGARSDYAAAYAAGWDAEPGNAFLLAESGDFDAALNALDRAASGFTWFHLQRRGILLAHKARIAALGGRPDVAREALDAIEAVPELGSLAAARALLSEARFHLEGDGSPGAIRHLFLARQLWTSAGIEYHAARTRLDIARALVALGDRTGATTEVAAAARTGARIGSRRLVDAAEAMAAGLAERSAAA
jgi:DNA-binding winged helix-turn-helix (wHTH) protein